MFNQQEVQILIGGVNSPIDLDDLQRHTNYGGLYDEKHETIVAFWKVYPVVVLVSLLLFVWPCSFYQVVNSFDQEQKRALLRFVTSCSRPPLLFVCLTVCLLFNPRLLIVSLRWHYSGFKELVPNFCIRDAGTDQYRLPTSSTCVNLLKVSFITMNYGCVSHPWDFKLPIYTSDRALRVKLLQAINSGAGFDLSWSFFSHLHVFLLKLL